MSSPLGSEGPTGSFFEELSRRHVVKVGLAYAAVAWLVLQLAGLVLPAFGAAPWILRAVIGLVVLLFPVALVLAWVYEVTPAGIRRTAPAPSGPTGPPTTARRIGVALNAVIALGLVGAVAVVAWNRVVEPGAPSAPRPGHETSARVGVDRSVAVLPFVDAAGDSTNTYFADGLAEDLIIALSHYPGLRVIGRTSSFQLRGEALDSREIGKKLGVTRILEGSVSREGRTLRLRAELVNAEDGSTVWSERYDRPYHDLFSLQDDLSEAVATALEPALLGSAAPVRDDRPPSGDLRAYDAYLKGESYASRFDPAGLRLAQASFREAIGLDPRYAAAYAALSHASTITAVGLLRGDERARALAGAGALADTAIALAPTLAAAHLARGTASLFSFAWNDAKAEYERAYQLAPSDPDAQRTMGVALALQGRVEDAAALQRRALASDPLDALGYAHLGQYLAGLGRYAEAEQAVRKAIALQPESGGARLQLAIVEIVQGHARAALLESEHLRASQWRRWGLAMAYAALRDTARADSALAVAIETDGDLAPTVIASIYALRGQPDETFAWLDRAWLQRDPRLGEIWLNPILSRYRKDPRFAAFCRKVGVPASGGDGPGPASSSHRSSTSAGS